MYEYRHNYYDDVIDFLDRRQKGLTREPPRAQTWAERAMRTAAHRPSASPVSTAARQDQHLLSHVSTAARFHRYHSKSLISRKYSSLGFMSIIIWGANRTHQPTTNQPIYLPINQPIRHHLSTRDRSASDPSAYYSASPPRCPCFEGLKGCDF